jgi:DNA mismatch repair protein MutS
MKIHKKYINMTTDLNEHTPMMKQYFEIKSRYPDCLVFYRLGDFYELFFDDAIIASRDLDIALTKRGKTQGQDIPMCGVPSHAYEVYLSKLIQKGHKVAICEQMEAPTKDQKGPVRRDVVRVVTPGTLVEEGLLSAKTHHFLVVITPIQKTIMGVGVFDLSTGTFWIEETNDLFETLTRIEPSELIVPDTFLSDDSIKRIIKSYYGCLTPLPLLRFNLANAQKRLLDYYKIKSMESFGDFKDHHIMAAGVIVDYVQTCQKELLGKLVYPTLRIQSNYLMIDGSSRESLDLNRRYDNRANLLDLMDETMTSMGGRLLGVWLTHPLSNAIAINKRLNRVSQFMDNEYMLNQTRAILNNVPDFERAMNRLHLLKPRDMGMIQTALNQCVQLIPLISKLNELIPHELLAQLNTHLEDEIPIILRDGHVIKSGVHDELDQFRNVKNHSRELLMQMQNRYANETNISNLKIRHNNVIGFHIDITPSHASKIPPHFIHRQTLTTSLRYSTPELNELALKITSAESSMIDIECRIYGELCDMIQNHSEILIQLINYISKIDVFSTFAFIAKKYNYIRPTVDDSLTCEIDDGRHPIVEKALLDQNESFISNSINLNQSKRMYLITGPNMAGKSTYLRQNALIIIMAHMGSFVPASSAHIGIVDRLFSRVGADDHLAAGRSTFMVEMIEAAAILNQSTSKSFVIVDEIGRGTSTYDGFAIACSVLEHLCLQNQCRGLFATHYHELVKMATTLPMLTNMSLSIKEWDGKIIFLFKVIEGSAERSYGIHVAELAGLPKNVISRAKDILKGIEKSQKGQKELFAVPSLFQD